MAETAPKATMVVEVGGDAGAIQVGDKVPLKATVEAEGDEPVHLRWGGPGKFHPQTGVVPYGGGGDPVRGEFETIWSAPWPAGSYSLYLYASFGRGQELRVHERVDLTVGGG